MRAASAAAVLLVCLLAVAVHAQSESGFLNVGGSYGQNWIGSFGTQPALSAQQSTDGGLWSWGGSPKGSIIVDGGLLPDPYYFWKSLNLTTGWLGKAYTDPQTGYPVYAYQEPGTGIVRYFYLDPKTRSPVYVNRDPSTATPYYTGYGGISPYYSPDYLSDSTAQSPLFNWDAMVI